MKTEELTIELITVERGKVKAVADVSFPTPVGEVTVRGFKVVESRPGEKWVAFPSKSYMKDGKQMNSPIIEVSRSLRRQLVDAIMNEYGAKTR